MRVVEIFKSIEGEGVRAGELATFIRLAGCNLRCSYCDTPYALKVSDGQDMTIDEILDKCEEFGTSNITLTGGEPLLLPESGRLIQELDRCGYNVNIETNGSKDISRATLYDGVFVTMDYKLPSSGVEGAMLTENFRYLREQDVLKFVVGHGDLPRVREVIQKYEIFRPYIYLSPVHGQVSPAELVEFLKELHEEKVSTARMRVQLQLHKYIWPADMRGV